MRQVRCGLSTSDVAGPGTAGKLCLGLTVCDWARLDTARQAGLGLLGALAS